MSLVRVDTSTCPALDDDFRAVMGPTPGTVINRVQISASRAGSGSHR